MELLKNLLALELNFVFDNVISMAKHIWSIKKKKKSADAVQWPRTSAVDCYLED